MAKPFIFIALAPLALAGCLTADGANQDPRCQPLAAGDCALPWPSSWFLNADATSATGYRVAIPATAVLPVPTGGPAFDVNFINTRDGFSPATSLVVNFKTHVDEAQLPHLTDVAAALQPSSRVQLLDAESGERVPLFAEVDHNVQGTAQDQVLLVHPAVRLAPGKRYIAVLQKLTDIDGNLIVWSPMEALKFRYAGSRLATLQGQYETMFDFLEKHGVFKVDITLAWDFVTASDTQLFAPILAMRDQALTRWESDALGATITMVNEPAGDPDLFRHIEGTFAVPSFLESDAATATLRRDAKGLPVYRAAQQFPLVIHIPQCALTRTGPLPVMIFGHGLFGSAAGEMGSGYEKSVINQLCMVQIGTDWIGLSENDAINVANTVVNDLSKFNVITDRLHQAQVNVVTLGHFARTRLKDLPDLVVGGTPVIDGSQVYYYGISQGGIEGGVFLALSPDVDHGVLNVGGGNYSVLLPRSTDFVNLKSLLDGYYDKQRDQQLLLTLLQSYWDPVDPISYAPYQLANTLPGPGGVALGARHLVMQEGIGDAQVSNVATRMVVRTMGLPYVGAPTEPVYGVNVVGGPVDAGYAQFNTHPDPLPPPYNLPATMDNSTHEGVRRIPQVIEQIRQLLKPSGQVVDTCNAAACDFPL